MKPYTCDDYRQEMILAALKKQLAAGDLDEAEKKRLEKQVHKMEMEMGLN